MFWNRIKSKEALEIEKKLDDIEIKIKDINRKLNALDTDLSLFWDKLNKAIARKVVRKEEDQDTKDLNDSMLLPDIYGIKKTIR